MTTYTLTHQENYAARIVKVRTLVDLAGLDNLKGLPVDGFTALVPKDTPIDSMMAVFPSGAALTEAFAGDRNLFRHSELNRDKDAKGYLEDSGRVKAIKLRGVVSSALALPVEDDAPEGTLFDTIDGTVVSQKWVNPNAPRPHREGQKKVRVQIELPEHFDSAHYLRNKTLIPQDAHISVTQKLHGTSVRVGRVAIEQPQKWWERLFRRPVRKEFEPVIGSRRVIKFAGNPTPGAVHYYGEGNDIWTQAGLPIAEVIPDGAVVYAEIAGYVGDTPIQSGYTYRHAKGTFSVYVYRVTIGGVDLHWNAVKAFCEQRGLKTVPELATQVHRDFVPENWTDLRFYQMYPNAISLDDESPVDEGVVIRWDGGLAPTVLKLKSPQFFVYEGISADAGKADIEEEESN